VVSTGSPTCGRSRCGARAGDAWCRPAVAAIGLKGPGALFRKFLRDSQIEVRKVVWPTRQETWQTTLVIVAVVVVVIGILIWIIDMILADPSAS
jgi:preprotein translocase SecE subunit